VLSRYFEQAAGANVQMVAEIQQALDALREQARSQAQGGPLALTPEQYDRNRRVIEPYIVPAFDMYDQQRQQRA
jgi:hypothetical protein